MPLVYPMNDQVLVLLDNEEDETRGGIYIQEDARHEPISGTIQGIGPRVTTVKKGEKAIIPWGTGVELAFFGKECRMIRENDIIGIIDK